MEIGLHSIFWKVNTKIFLFCCLFLMAGNLAYGQTPFPGCFDQLFLTQADNQNSPIDLIQIGQSGNPFIYTNVIGTQPEVYNAEAFNGIDNIKTGQVRIAIIDIPSVCITQTIN